VADAAGHAKTQRRPGIAVATGAVVLAGATAGAGAAAAAVGDSQRAPANEIAAELGALIRNIGPETFAAQQALHGARITALGKSIAIPAAAQAAWHRRLLDIDRAHATISRVSGADASRGAALHALDVLRAVCRSGQLALTSPTAAKRDHYAKQQAAQERRLRPAIERLTGTLQRAGATRL
jgi:hypothetical protein